MQVVLRLRARADMNILRHGAPEFVSIYLYLLVYALMRALCFTCRAATVRAA